MGVTADADAGPILIWGAGAVGGTIAACLARAGHAIALVDVVAEHVAAIAERGLTLEGPLGGFTQQLAAFTPAQLHGRHRRSLLCVQAQHTAAAAAALRSNLADDGYIISAQNGLNEREVAARHGRATPMLDRLVCLVHDIEDGQRAQGRANLDALAEAAR